MLVHRLRRWPNIGLPLRQCLMFSERARRLGIKNMFGRGVKGQASYNDGGVPDFYNSECYSSQERFIRIERPCSSSGPTSPDAAPELEQHVYKSLKYFTTDVCLSLSYNWFIFFRSNCNLSSVQLWWVQHCKIHKRLETNHFICEET